MMNECLRNLNKIEFVMTYACTGHCKHCSEGNHASCGEHIDGKRAAEAVKAVCAHYPIKTVMTFGGEPLLYPEELYPIHAAAREAGVAKRQVITNGYVTKDPEKMAEIVKGLSACGVNEVLLSVDAFHQETIPLDTVLLFAREVMKQKIPIKLSPAWLVSKQDENHYNQTTQEILSVFTAEGFVVGEGNIVFPEGNAAVFLKEYFNESLPQNPYREDARDLRCLSFSPDGSVLQSNLYQNDILNILKNYRP